MTFKERKDKLISLKKEISRIRAEQTRQKSNKNIDLGIGIATAVESVIALQIFKENPNEIAYLITTGALFTSSLISFYNYKNFDYIMAYYDNEVSYLREEMTKTLK